MARKNKKIIRGRDAQSLPESFATQGTPVTLNITGVNAFKEKLDLISRSIGAEMSKPIKEPPMPYSPRMPDSPLEIRALWAFRRLLTSPYGVPVGYWEDLKTQIEMLRYFPNEVYGLIDRVSLPNAPLYKFIHLESRDAFRLQQFPESARSFGIQWDVRGSEEIIGTPLEDVVFFDMVKAIMDEEKRPGSLWSPGLQLVREWQMRNQSPWSSSPPAEENKNPGENYFAMTLPTEDYSKVRDFFIGIDPAVQDQKPQEPKPPKEPPSPFSIIEVDDAN
jgi:hypothetical protein